MCGLCAVRKRKRSNPSDVLCRSLRYLVDLQGFHICRPFYSLIFIIECCITPTVPQCNIVSSFSVFIDRSLLITLPAHIDFYIQKYRARIWLFYLFAWWIINEGRNAMQSHISIFSPTVLVFLRYTLNG